jgi:hypothetical protein
LLIDGHKFDLRIYVAVTSINPLRVYVYDEGLARFASVKYDIDDTKNVYSHLTNYSINKKNHSKETHENKWSLKKLKEYLHNLKKTSKKAKKLDVDKLFAEIDSIVVKTMISVEPLSWNSVQMFLPNAYQFNQNADIKQKNNNCFELLGFDIFIDSAFKPWLLEVNLSPSLTTDTQLDFDIKSQVVKDLLNLVGMQNNEQ